MKELISVLAVVLLFSGVDNKIFGQKNLQVSPGNIPSISDPKYDSWQAAFDDVYDGGASGSTPYITVIGDMTEGSLSIPLPPGGAVLDKSGSSFTSVTIQTAGVFTVKSPASVIGPIMTFKGITFSTINGFNAAGPDGIGLTLEYLDLSITRVPGCIQLLDGSSDNTFSYLGCKTASLNGRLFWINSSILPGIGNDRNVIHHCLFDGGLRGYQVFGTNIGAGAFNKDNVIRNSIIKNASTIAVFLGTATMGNVCDENVIYMDRVLDLGVAIDYRGINIQAVGNNYIRKNKIHDLTFSPSVLPYSFYGIVSLPVIPAIAGGPYPAHVDIINNCVTLMDNNSYAPFIYGIAPATAIPPDDNPYSVNVYNNTSRVGGLSNGFTTCKSYAMLIKLETPGSSAKSYNNICSNERTGGASGSSHIGYDISAFPLAGVTLNSDYNLGTSDDAVFGSDAGYDGTLYKGGYLSAYKDATCGVGIEQHTSNDDVTFTDPNSCIFAAGSIGGNMCGKTPLVPPVLDDITNSPRHSTYPYKGCFEGAPLKVLTLKACLDFKVDNGEIQVFLETAGCSPIAQCFGDLDINTNTTKLCYGDAVSNSTPYQLDVKSINHIQTFSLTTTTFISGTASYDFLTQGAFGGNLSNSGCFFGGDRDQNSFVDLNDLLDVHNSNTILTFTAGCRLIDDMDSDGFITLTDVLITSNASIAFVGVETPCPEPNSSTVSNNVSLKSKKLHLAKINSEANIPVNF